MLLFVNSEQFACSDCYMSYFESMLCISLPAGNTADLINGVKNLLAPPRGIKWRVPLMMRMSSGLKSRQ